MEPENSDEAITTSEETSTQTSVATTRSYECHFCKRGFTNAQALGGHMNIHRKHKAKLKESTPPSNTNPISSSSSHGKKNPLPLFGEGLSGSRDVHQENTSEIQSLLVPPEVDLELRLGQIKSPKNKNTTTRKFF